MRKLLPSIRRAAFMLLLVACGSRTGLFVDDEDGFTNVTPPGGDAGPDARRRDAGRDGEGEIDAAPPPIDARPTRDADRSDCPDASATLVYTITSTYDLQSFNPDTGQFKLIGKISCPAQAGATPFSMAVDRKGVAYVVFTDDRIYRVSTLNAACTSTPYVAGQSNYLRFGMGFTTNSIGPTETLYVAGSSQDNGAEGLAEINPKTFKLSPVGDFNPPVHDAELTGTGDGRLFAFYTKSAGATDSYIGQIDTDNADVVGERHFPNVDQGNGWAFAFWGGDFYMFHAPNGGSLVTRWRPSDDSVVQVASTSLKIVGAGVSTCAPQE